MEAIMQWIMKICARGALGLGAAALLLSGVPAHANPAGGAASRESQPCLLAQSKAQTGEAEKLEQQRLEEQQKQVQEQRQKKQIKAKKMRGPMPEAAPPDAAREASPPPPGAKRFGAGVIRQSEKPVDGE
jgi:hypothetical protein